jgi:hypothetical protein
VKHNLGGREIIHTEEEKEFRKKRKYQKKPWKDVNESWKPARLTLQENLNIRKENSSNTKTTPGCLSSSSQERSKSEMIYLSFLSLWKKILKFSLIHPPCVADKLLHCKILQNQRHRNGSYINYSKFVLVSFVRWFPWLLACNLKD